MIKKVTICNFKSIENIELELESVNILVGTNNAGKTSVMQGVQFGCSIVQSINVSCAIPWRIKKDFPRSLEPAELIYSPLKDVSALARGGELKSGDKYKIKITYEDEKGQRFETSVKRGKNRNVVATINKSDLAKTFASLEEPVCIYVPGLAGIPYNEEFKSESIVRKAAAKGDANSVLRNILLLLHKDNFQWEGFLNKFQSLFPNKTILIKFNEKVDEYIDVRIKEITDEQQRELPIDAAGTGVLQAIQILSYIYLYHPQLLILDEPDAHLHPSNQRNIMKLLFEMAKEEDFQLLISTHSRHILDEARDEGKIIWIHDGKVVSEKYNEFDVLAGLGALDVRERLKNGQIKCVLLTEDSTEHDMLRNVLRGSMFNLDETDIWSYNCCTNVMTAKTLANYIRATSPGVRVIIHRDRDYLTEEEQIEYKDKICVDGNECAITLGTDIESYYISAEHIHAIYSGITVEQAKSIIKKAMEDTHNKCLTKFINARYDIEESKRKRNNEKPINKGELFLKCQEEYNANELYYRHGKTVIKRIKQIINEDYKLNSKQIIGASDFLKDSKLTEIAISIWGGENK